MLTGQTVIVTGSSRGIGRGIALRFAKAGANIVLNGRGEADPVLISEIESHGVQTLFVAANVKDEMGAAALIEQAHERFGRIDVLVNNAGITNDKLLMRMSQADFTSVLDVNLTGTFNTIKAVSKILLKQKQGTIINLASVVGLTGNAGQANYAASKAGVVGLTKSVARELSSRGITCNAIAPGYIDTEMTDVLSDRVKEGAQAQIPLKRFGKVEDVAEAALFLATNRYITGQVLNVDGGMVMQG